MESRLKALKVVELKDLLQKANVAIPAKANKPDLIAKILSSQAAIGVFESSNGSEAGGSSTPSAVKQASTPKPAAIPVPTSSSNAKKEVLETNAAADGQTSDLLAPPEEIDWSAVGASSTSPAGAAGTASTASKPISSTQPPAPVDAPTSTSGEPSTSIPEVEDEETMRRRKRAERFGIPFVEPKKPAAAAPRQNQPPSVEKAKVAAVAKPVKVSAAPVEDTEKLNTRAARFGLPAKSSAEKTSVVAGQKRPAPTSAEEADAEELERRRKRAERFGIKV